MNHHYNDIRSKLGSPQWWDECGVPRYCEFSPKQTNNIYARECALVLIACQNCGQTFKVAMAWNDIDLRTCTRKPAFDAELIISLHYGDPPNIECCPSGPTMNCEDLRVLEFWRMGADHDWERVLDLEVLLPDHPEFHHEDLPR